MEAHTEWKTIRLMGLVTENYCLSASQSKSTFHMYWVLDIMLGHEIYPNPVLAAESTSSDTQSISGDADTAERPITPALHKSIEQIAIPP